MKVKNLFRLIVYIFYEVKMEFLPLTHEVQQEEDKKFNLELKQDKERMIAMINNVRDCQGSKIYFVV